MIKAVIFDLNGVFIQSRYLSQRVEEDYGVKEEEFVGVLEDIMPIVRAPNAPDIYPLWKPYLEKWNINLDEEGFLRYWFSGEKINWSLLDYVKTLKEKGLKVFVLSNNFKERINYYKKEFKELFEVMTKVYFSGGTGFIKPNPKAWEVVLEENNLKPEDCFYFDDSVKNIKVAENLGIRSIKFEGLLSVKKVLEPIITK